MKHAAQVTSPPAMMPAGTMNLQRNMLLLAGTIVTSVADVRCRQMCCKRWTTMHRVSVISNAGIGSQPAQDRDQLSCLMVLTLSMTGWERTCLPQSAQG